MNFRLSQSSLRQLTFRSSKDVDRIVGSRNNSDTQLCEPKEILLSYVRAEAAHHAITLKQELNQLGFQVFLVSRSFQGHLLGHHIKFISNNIVVSRSFQDQLIGHHSKVVITISMQSL